MSEHMRRAAAEYPGPESHLEWVYTQEAVLTGGD